MFLGWPFPEIANACVTLCRVWITSYYERWRVPTRPKTCELTVIFDDEEISSIPVRVFFHIYTRSVRQSSSLADIPQHLYDMCTTPSRQPKTFLRDSTSLWESRRVIATYTRVYCELWPLNYEKHTRKDDIWVFWYKYRYKINFLAHLDPHISPQSKSIRGLISYASAW